LENCINNKVVSGTPADFKLIIKELSLFYKVSMPLEGMGSNNEDYKSHGNVRDNKGTSDNNNNTGRKAVSTTSKTKNNLEDYKGYFMSVRPPKINYSTIIIKPSSRGAVAATADYGKKETLSDKAKDVEDSIKRSLHIRKSDKT
jgi:hypothetical protein